MKKKQIKLYSGRFFKFRRQKLVLIVMTACSLLSGAVIIGLFFYGIEYLTANFSQSSNGSSCLYDERCNSAKYLCHYKS